MWRSSWRIVEYSTRHVSTTGASTRNADVPNAGADSNPRPACTMQRCKSPRGRAEITCGTIQRGNGWWWRLMESQLEFRLDLRRNQREPPACISQSLAQSWSSSFSFQFRPHPPASSSSRSISSLRFPSAESQSSCVQFTVSKRAPIALRNRPPWPSQSRRGS